ncbi:flagellar cap protein [Idiomarina sp. OT37-5b]|uniref:flagellar filament capping protein FliD n=1 Tax=Idiomarina sp. OT37-5b TaxID=2100422 RepID=UPI000CF9B023|nr:flagellar filament capping protein FliD [Idiomarina sp. OT37-5b]AVJ55360.1 flagellar cap protein [Idiomarina sp. OT37-5b]
MPLFSSAGVGSGLDLESIIKSTVAASDQPKQVQFAKAERRYSTELSSLGSVKSALSKLDDVMAKLANPDEFAKRTATITQPASGDIISFSAGNEATSGTFDIAVNQLAQGSRAVSTDGAFTSADDVITSQASTLTFGAGTESFSVSVDANATLEDIRQAINESADNFGVTANIINTGSEAKLVYNSEVTGAGNDLEVTNDNAELDALSTVANGGGAGGMTIAAGDEAMDAEIVIDGIVATNSTNTFKDVIQGSTVTAEAVGEAGENAVVEVGRDREGVTKLVDEFIKSYNTVIDVMNKATATGAPLQADATMRGLERQMASTLTSKVANAGDFETLFDIGISMNDEGKLEKTNVVRSFDEALDQDIDSVAKVFSSAEGFASQFEGLMDNYIDSRGAITFREKALNENLDRLDDSRESHQYRMEQLEARLREKYTGLDTMLAQMQSTQQYLSAQLSNLPGFGGKD